ncbi:exodeoxyribonuclease VII small subunit [Patescibacteria group bacterium]|nr:exodeoxyribonuclease VII small subunit [Patescibacteria group bacterium]
MKKTNQPKKTSQNFSQAFAELQAITEQFEKEDLDLEQAMKQYEKGLELSKQLKARLQQMANTVEEMKKKHLSK